jgi:hypothetical protein
MEAGQGRGVPDGCHAPFSRVAHQLMHFDSLSLMFACLLVPV